jgi:hypothetical protein
MKYATEMGSGPMIYIISFIRTGSGIEEDSDIQKAWRLHKPTLIFSK